MKPRTVMLLFFSSGIVAALIGFAMAGPPDFDFLKEYADLANGWHQSSWILQYLTFSISVLGGGIALIQSKRIKIVKREVLTVLLSFVIAVLNAGLAFFFTDFRTYEKASIRYNMQIESFRALNESLDVTDPQIAQEFAHAKATLIQNLQEIRIGLIEGQVTSRFALMPQVYAQDARAWKPADTSHFIYSIGTGFNASDLQRAKASAIADADSGLINGIRSQVELELSRQGLQPAERAKVLGQLFSPSSNTEILSHAQTEKNYFSKIQTGYRYSVVKRIMKDVAVFHYLDLVRTQTTLNQVPGLSKQRLEQFIQTKRGR